jgi:hypothetical protein
MTVCYFSAISKRADELNAIGQTYLDKLPFMSNDAICQRLWDIAWEIDAAGGENPDWVESTLDSHIPYGVIPRGGSLYFSLGFAAVANDACLRNLLEVAEGRETEKLDLATVAEKEVVESYCDLISV